MNQTFATVDDLAARWRPLTIDEQNKAETLLTDTSAQLRVEAYKAGKDLDELAATVPGYRETLVSVCCDVVKRYINDNAQEGPAMSQYTESALGYSVSGTYLVPGGGLFVKKSELARLGLNRQKLGVISLC